DRWAPGTLHHRRETWRAPRSGSCANAMAGRMTTPSSLSYESHLRGRSRGENGLTGFTEHRGSHEEAGVSAGGRGRPLADRRQVGRPRRLHRLDGAGRLEISDLLGGIAQRVEQLELRPVVLGDRGEVLVEGQLHE